MGGDLVLVAAVIQIELNLGTGRGVKPRRPPANEVEARATTAVRTPDGSRGRRWKHFSSVEDSEGRAGASVRNEAFEGSTEGASRSADILRSLTDNPGRTAARHLQATAGTTRRDTEGIGRHSAARHPTVIDRFVQQAVMQVLQAVGMERSPRRASASGRSARRSGCGTGAGVHRVRPQLCRGHRSGEVLRPGHHDILMVCGQRVADKRLLKLIRGFLTAGVMEGGRSARRKRVRRKVARSPLLSNLMLMCWTRNWRTADIATRATPTTELYVRSRSG